MYSTKHPQPHTIVQAVEFTIFYSPSSLFPVSVCAIWFQALDIHAKTRIEGRQCQFDIASMFYVHVWLYVCQVVRTSSGEWMDQVKLKHLYIVSSLGARTRCLLSCWRFALCYHTVFYLTVFLHVHMAVSSLAACTFLYFWVRLGVIKWITHELKSNHPSIIYTPYPVKGLPWAWSRSQLLLEERQRTLWTDQPSITGLTHKDRRSFALTLAPMGNSESQISLASRFWLLEETHASTGRICKLSTEELVKVC